MSCCPPNSCPFLAADYKAHGRVISLPSEEGPSFDYYMTGDEGSERAILMISDVFGWNGGRIRILADAFADDGYLVMIPKLLVPALNGGTDGDGLPPDFVSSSFPTVGVPYLKSITWEDIKPKIAAAVEHMKELGARRYGLIGYCWGGWVVTHILADEAIGASAVGGVIAHPSNVNIETNVFPNDRYFAALVKLPVLLMPAGNDPDEYRAGGSFLKALQAGNKLSSTTDEFRSMQHGWMPRGDIADPNVKNHVELGMRRIKDFLLQQFAA